ncbi:flagellar motor protein MotP [Alkalihalobacillus alcalophilus ATCC 27647 = CGMCC 1.3604]|uniref:Flagellar motor protein MotP n=2 Tax=Alkalihalobacillus alcalophilus TaxID=1445 RepID=A0A094WL00_ALKAL|nr:flagellar motor protein MotP [Alkalihalobacillus alcalophilus]AEW31367.1 flagellar motor protein [Alkalihalobacillus alcalophilus]KGA96618.1 flagellar motor protein MotP [Alkalihalobacillus alcalophilus ATCC 27647 = CGMCC 1.3604]MED1561691.1 flagellar motor protein MotP [Alkalihalobacillus alcalophilus]THG92264.1 flagellar motor protein MotP [Alkalihalobacillus alcalophilus ATCC 27647 = CGMCC 1.3604]
MKKLDLMTPIGLFLGLTVLLMAIIASAGPSGLGVFVDLASIFIVLGGLLAALVVNFSLKEILIVPKMMIEVFRTNEQNIGELIDTFVELSSKARREGLLALEAGVEEVEDRFIKKGILLAVDGIEQDVIKDILMAEVIAMEDRHRHARSIFERASEYAPAWGMIGTLIGLVLMLQNMDDPALLGPAMAIAMITTLYGAVLANLIFTPMAAKLANKTEEEVFLKQIIIEGVIGVQSGQNPKILQEKLNAFNRQKPKKEEVIMSQGEQNAEA